MERTWQETLRGTLVQGKGGQPPEKSRLRKKESTTRIADPQRLNYVGLRGAPGGNGRNWRVGAKSSKYKWEGFKKQRGAKGPKKS